MPHSLSDEAASIPLELIHFLKEIRRQRDSYSLSRWHTISMTQSMIILKVYLLHSTWSGSDAASASRGAIVIAVSTSIVKRSSI
jgi:hypothetical protein